MQELRELVTRAARYQDSLRLSDKTWCARYVRFVGSPKTWRDRLRDGQGGVQPEKWKGRLRELLGILEGGSVVTEFFETPFYARLDAGVGLLEGQVNDRRVFACLAQTGSGKTVCSRKLVAACMEPNWHGPRRVFVTALTTWRENKVTILRGLAEALNCLPQHTGASPAMNAVVSALRSDPRTIVIDEAHQGGVMLMRVVKDLVNETPARFVYLALRTEFDRVRSSNVGSIVEAKQFLRRCQQPVFDDYADGVGPRDVLVMLKAAGVMMDGAKTVADDLAALVRTRGNLSTLADALERARVMAAEEDQEVDALAVLEALRQLCGVAN